MISANADQEPMMKIEIENRMVPIMLDTGATYTCLSPTYASHLPKSGKYVKTVGFSGLTQMIPMTAPVRIKIKDSEIKIPVLISDQTPVNLLGRDAICKLKLQIWCSPEGICIDKEGLKQMIVLEGPREKGLQANVFWVGDIQKGVENTLKKWGRYMREQFSNATAPEAEYHCTMRFDPSKNKEIEENWLKETQGQRVSLTSEAIIIGPVGAALSIRPSDFTKTWFKVEDSVPHVTLLISEGNQPQDLGSMMREAESLSWKTTENPYILQTDDRLYLKILCTTEMIGTPKLVIEETKKEASVTRIEELRIEMEGQVPLSLWSRHDTDVGLVKSANPIRIAIKYGMQLPRKPQYPLKPDAVEGIKNTIINKSSIITSHHFTFFLGSKIKSKHIFFLDHLLTHKNNARN